MNIEPGSLLGTSSDSNWFSLSSVLAMLLGPSLPHDSQMTTFSTAAEATDGSSSNAHCAISESNHVDRKVGDVGVYSCKFKLGRRTGSENDDGR